jgi:hypothetical protein
MDSGLMEPSVRFFDDPQLFVQGRQQRFGLLFSASVIPLAEAALPVVELDIELRNLVVIDKTSKLLGPFEVVDLPLEQFSPELVARHDLDAVAHDEIDPPDGDKGNSGKGNYHASDRRHHLPADPYVSPVFHLAPPSADCLSSLMPECAIDPSLQLEHKEQAVSI